MKQQNMYKVLANGLMLKQEIRTTYGLWQLTGMDKELRLVEQIDDKKLYQWFKFTPEIEEILDDGTILTENGEYVEDTQNDTLFVIDRIEYILIHGRIETPQGVIFMGSSGSPFSI